jgi:hypothetical protein
MNGTEIKKKKVKINLFIMYVVLHSKIYYKKIKLNIYFKLVSIFIRDLFFTILDVFDL